jgi:hypothetical protein
MWDICVSFFDLWDCVFLNLIVSTWAYLAGDLYLYSLYPLHPTPTPIRPFPSHPNPFLNFNNENENGGHNLEWILEKVHF